HFTRDRSTMGARATLCGHELGLGLQFVDIFRNGECVPDLDAVVGETGDEKRRRQQQEFGPRSGVVAGRLLLLELETGHLAKQPAAQRPRAIILAGDGERGHALSPFRWMPEKIISQGNMKSTSLLWCQRERPLPGGMATGGGQCSIRPTKPIPMS